MLPSQAFTERDNFYQIQPNILDVFQENQELVFACSLLKGEIYFVLREACKCIVLVFVIYPKMQAIKKVMAGRMLYIAAANVAVVYFNPK